MKPIARALMAKPRLLMLETGDRVLPGLAAKLAGNARVTESYLGLKGSASQPAGVAA